MFRSNLFIILIAIAGALLGLYAGSYLNRPRVAGLPAGTSLLAPGGHLTDLQLSGTDGQAHRFGDWRGKLVLVNFWATWCEPCREEMPLLDAASKHYANAGFTVVGVAIDDPDAVASMLKMRPVSYPILFGGEDTLKTVGDDNGVLPYSLLIGPGGKMITLRAGSFTSARSLARWIEPHLANPG
ncbi:MAG: TlpA family protein disulfide reductase [Xanthomonadaceae bacterium]|nr:TlpA family protein disulfide reductase [Xanthomonadaceae bacterium]MDE2083782.1 TlpA family protein disulfide reductase [Xanthomonadaceae bacterium]MDE2257963.1 TlpA family protein disulfide reductase [Xanthomonadaceae bacterium]